MPKRKPPKSENHGEFKKPENFGKTLNSFIRINLGKLEELAEGKKKSLKKWFSIMNTQAKTSANCMVLFDK